MVDRGGEYFIITNNLRIKKSYYIYIYIYIYFSIVNDMLACRLFRKFLKASKCCGEVNEKKISTYRR